MKNLNFKNRKFIKPLLLILLTVILTVTTVFAVKNFADKKAVVNAEAVKSVGLQNEKPKDFEPQIKVNKYIGGDCELDSGEIVINYPDTYGATSQTISADSWYEDEDRKTYLYNSSDLNFV